MFSVIVTLMDVSIGLLNWNVNGFVVDIRAYEKIKAEALYEWVLEEDPWELGMIGITTLGSIISFSKIFENSIQRMCLWWFVPFSNHQLIIP